MAYNFRGTNSSGQATQGTLYPQNYGGYDLSPEEQQLIDMALSGRNASSPEQAISNGFMAQDLMKRALYEQSVAEQQYRQRQEDERKQMLAEQDLALQNQADEAQFGRQAKLAKAGIVGRVAESAAGTVDPMTGMSTGSDLSALAGELDKILGSNQPKNTGIQPYSNTIKNSKGQVVAGLGKNSAETENDKKRAAFLKRLEAMKNKGVGARSEPAKPEPPKETATKQLPKGFDESSPLGKILFELLNMKRLTPEEYQKLMKGAPPIYTKAG